MVKRILVTLVLLPIGLVLISVGGWAFSVLVILFLGVAAYEYVDLFRKGDIRPAMVIVVGGVILLAAGRTQWRFEYADWILAFIILISMCYHLVAYERGRDQSGSDFAVTLAGVLYIGWLGAYLISLRNLPEGKWWFLVVMPAVWLADSGAYLIGSRFGRRKLSPRLSPKKTWEGYLAGILFGVLGGGLFAALWRISAGPETHLTFWRGALIGLVMSVFPTLGDLGESMFKRQVGVKDSGTILPGHGGAFDRIDSWLWGGVIGYYMILLITAV